MWFYLSGGDVCRSEIADNVVRLLFIFVLTFSSVACKKETEKNRATENATLFAQGKVIYLTRCTACHNTDPKFAGSLGPEILGSSKELITLRVLEAKYPKGYKPKRNSNLMIPMPDLREDIEALYEYLK